MRSLWDDDNLDARRAAKVSRDQAAQMYQHLQFASVTDLMQ